MVTSAPLRETDLRNEERLVLMVMICTVLAVAATALLEVEADIHHAARMVREADMAHQEDELHHHNKHTEGEADIRIEVSVQIGAEVATLDLPQWPELSEVVWQLEP